MKREMPGQILGIYTIYTFYRFYRKIFKKLARGEREEDDENDSDLIRPGRQLRKGQRSRKDQGESRLIKGSSLFSVEWSGEFWVLVIRFVYPNGIAAISPGLRGTSYLG